MKKLSTELTDRELRFDGVTILAADQVAAALLLGVPPSLLRVKELNQDLEIFNENVPNEDQIRAAVDEPISINMAWQLPKKYQDLDLREYLTSKLLDYLERVGASVDEAVQAEQRFDAEVDEIVSRGMVEFVKTVVYVLDVFREKGVVWGVGRGSSCASFVLFTIGLHAVDCLKYNVPMEEFFHD